MAVKTSSTIFGYAKIYGRFGRYKRLTLQMYLEGLSFNSIGRILKVSYVSVSKWIKKYGQQAEEFSSNQEIQVMELDEMHSYIGSKKTIFGLLLPDMENGSLK